MRQMEPVKGSANSSLHSGMVLALFLVGVSVGAVGYRVAGSLSVRSGPQPAADQSVPQIVTEGQRMVVPDGSPLRNKLVVEAVAEKEVQRNLVLPAVVEADPARLLKVLPPLAGRITQLK